MSIAIKIESLVELLKKNHKTQGFVIDEETNLINDLGFDSIDLIRIIVEIENEFSIDFSVEELDVEKVMKVGELFYLIKTKLDQ